MDILGTVKIEVKLNQTRPIIHEFNSKTYNTILLCRDLMKLFGSVTFDFENNRVQPAKVWHQGLTVRKKEQVHIKEKTVIPDRSEQTVFK